MQIQPNFIELLQQRLANSNLIYPQFDSPARELVNSLQTLLDSPLNPIQAVCADIASGEENVAILIKAARHIQAVERMLSGRLELGAVEVISPSQLKSHSCFSRLIVIGPTYWYDDYVFQSPRAHYIHIVKYKWVNDRKSTSSVFAGSAKYSGVDSTDRDTVGSSGTQDNAIIPGNSLDPEDFLPSIDWTAF